MPLGARRVFRLSAAVALSLAIAYGFAFPLPFIAPIFSLILGATPGPPLGLKALLGLVVMVMLTTGIGLLLIPLLLDYPFSAILIVTLGLYFCNYLTLIAGKAMLGLFLTVGFTMISAAGTVSVVLATTVIEGLVFAIAIAVVCQWVVYPLFPEDAHSPAPLEEAPAPAEQSNWIAIRATLIILPSYFLGLSNPTLYLPIIMKSVSLGQQGSVLSAHEAGRELLGSTFLGGCYAIAFWFLLDLVTTLWMFSALMLLFSVHVISRMYGLIATRWPPSFWQNVLVTMLILLGPAVEDSANGKDVYAAFFVRMGLFIAVTLYACFAVYLLEHLRSRHLHKRRH